MQALAHTAGRSLRLQATDCSTRCSRSVHALHPMAPFPRTHPRTAPQTAFRKWRRSRCGRPSTAALAAEAVRIAAPGALPPEHLSPWAARGQAGMRVRQLRSMGHGASTTRTPLVHTATGTAQQHKQRRNSGGSSSVVALAWARSSSTRVGATGGGGSGAGAASARALLVRTQSQRVLPAAREAAGSTNGGAQEAAVEVAGALPGAGRGAGLPVALRRAVRSSDPGTGSVVGRGLGAGQEAGCFFAAARGLSRALQVQSFWVCWWDLKS